LASVNVRFTPIAVADLPEFVLLQANDAALATLHLCPGATWGGKRRSAAFLSLLKISLPGVFFEAIILRERLRKCCYERTP
jgi:hypothetical protein